MFGWLRRAPGVARVAFLCLSIAAIAFAAPHFGQSVRWETAVIYGTALAIAMRWPIILPGTGARVVIVTGLVMEALWRHGLPTATVTLLVEFAIRMLVVYRGPYYWEWYRPVFVVGSFSVAYGLQVLTASNLTPSAQFGGIHFDTSALVMVYAFWVALNASWTIVKPLRPGRSRTMEVVQCLQQTWWAPLLFLVVAWPLELVHRTPFPLEIPAAFVLVWIQSVIGPAFTAQNQDRALNGLVQSLPGPSHEERSRVHRIIRIAHSIGRALNLSSREMRLIGYAALLQNWSGPERTKFPLWLPTPPAPDEARQIRQHVNTIAMRIELDGALQEVASLIRHRYASYDGRGIPAVAGDAFPIAAQVLAAANAVIMLTEGGLGRPMRNAEVMNWLNTYASQRFSPRVLWAVGQVLCRPEPVDHSDRELPEVVRQLQGLVYDSGAPSPLWTGLRRVWNQIRGQMGMAPDLPVEVRAMARLATVFASSTEAGRTAHFAAEVVGQLLSAKVIVALREKGETELTLKCQATYGFTSFDPLGTTVLLHYGAVSRAMLDQLPVQVADLREVQTALAQEVAALEGVRSALYLPIVHRGQTAGLLFVGLQRHHWFTPREVGLIQLMAGQAAAALDNANLIEEAEERLQRITSLNTFTDTLLDNLWSGIIVVDPEGLVIMANVAARRQLGEELAVVLGQRLPEDLAKAAQVDMALSGEAGPEVDWVFGPSILEVQSVPLKGNDGVNKGAICLVRDVTQERSMEQQVRRVEKLAAIGELAAGAAHEIRNPLTSIRGFIQLLQARASRSDGEYFQIILNEIDRIDWIIRDMLLLARPTALSKRDTSIPAVLDEILLLHQSDLQRTNITVVKEFDPEVGLVAVDPKMFRQLLLNLIINAMQAMPYGGTLGLALRPEGNGQIALQVSDTGVGISPENLKRLFVPFFTTKEEGTGLGLALCYSIVQAHGGKIDVRSQVGQGTCFTITLPVR